MITIHQTAELISLGLTIPTLVLSGVVVYVWSSSLTRRPQSANEWFILGVVQGFAGAFLDNLYWAIPWTASFLGLESSNDLIMAGVYFNIFFRQGFGISAAYCHLKAAHVHNEETMQGLNRILATANVLGVFYSIVIIYLYLKG